MTHDHAAPLRSRALLMAWLVADDDSARVEVLQGFVGDEVDEHELRVMLAEFLTLAGYGPSYEERSDESIQVALLTLIVALGHRLQEPAAVEAAEEMLEGAAALQRLYADRRASEQP